VARAGRPGARLEPGETFRVGDGSCSRELRVEEASIRTTALVLGDERHVIEGRELELVFDASRWRYDIPSWRWQRGVGDLSVRARARVRPLARRTRQPAHQAPRLDAAAIPRVQS
jgi:hypothetical protein